MGVISAFINYFGQNLISDGWSLVGAMGDSYMHWTESSGAEALGFFMFVILCIYMAWDALKAKK
ncbi:MAG: hypothetical protein EH225_06980 [Calditrichaeota bacterium]|nr:MAG: hypothetical protein EH225_06980 [Calditrichota bacterium]